MSIKAREASKGGSSISLLVIASLANRSLPHRMIASSGWGELDLARVQVLRNLIARLTLLKYTNCE